MRSPNALALVVVIGCGSSPAPTKNEVVAKPRWSPAVPTCEEVGIILRGPVEAESETAGPQREAAIANACKGDRWSQSTIDCVASQTNPLDCLAALTAAQRATYNAIYDGTDAVDASQVAAPVTCFDALHSIELFDPPITDASPEPEWEKIVRQRDLASMCSADAWTDEQLTCLRDATTDTATAACVATLDPKVHARLLVVRDLARLITRGRKTPAKLECSKVAEHHYSDAKAKQELKSMKPADRKTLIQGVRKTMSDACTNEAWDEATRACMIADGGEETCFGSVRWGSVKPTVQLYAIPACAEYARAVADFQGCSAAPLETRNAMQQALQDVDRATVGTMTADQKRALEAACQSSANTVRQVIAAFGC